MSQSETTVASPWRLTLHNEFAHSPLASPSSVTRNRVCASLKKYDVCNWPYTRGLEDECFI